MVGQNESLQKPTSEHDMSINSKPLQPIRQIKNWFEYAVPSPESINVTTQLGVHLEEVAEMLEPLRDAAVNQETMDQMNFFIEVLNHAQKRFKSHHESFKFDMRYVDRKALLDALCDQIVTAVGVAHMYGLNIEGALQEVADSNDSKFDEAGHSIFNESRKIMKGPKYFAPDLTKFI
jgi:hypothetical protein